MLLKLYGITVLSVLLMVLWWSPVVYAGQPEESRLKAVFVLNFAKLTEWPTDIRSDGNIFTIAIIGKAPSPTFINVLKGQTVHGASVSVRHVDNVRQAKGSQLLFISDSERQSLPVILKEVSLLPILTVSDMPGFSEAGGMIGLVPVQKRLGFEVNVAAARKSRLSLSSQLLKLAKTIFGN
ncbi:MAG: YfiR family protein [Pseudomonadota bacterium]